MGVPDGKFCLGPGTLQIDRRQLHGPIRQGVVKAMQEKLKEGERGVAVLQGGSIIPVYSTDGEHLFRQEPYFHYLFGANEDEFWGALDVRNGRSYLFIPQQDASYAVWCGPVHGPDYFKAKYCVDEVHYIQDMATVLGATQPPCLHMLAGTNTDSGFQLQPPSFEGSAGFTIETAVLFGVLNEARVHKTQQEVEVLQYVSDVGSRAHIAMMQSCKPGTMEYQLESMFQHYTYTHGGCRFQGYTCIAASGPNGAVLHYGHASAPNDRQIEDGDLVLLDMGCEYYRYGSDITCTWPSNGKFTQQQAVVYNAVLDAHDSVVAAMAPGVSWLDMQTLAYRKILGGLAAGGLLKGDVEAMIEAEIGGVFMPHGLGHFLGISTHDVGGYGPGYPERSSRPGFKSLRTARKLEEGMVITVEPGCYFNPALLEPAYEDPARAQFLVREALAAFMSMGGVRIESNVLVTADGRHTMTNVPRTISEVESVMAGAAWPVRADAAAEPAAKKACVR